MKTINILLAPTLLFLFFGIASCKKNGTGGKASLHVMVYNGSTPIKASTIYVKFGTQTQPTDAKNNFDLKVQGEEDDNHVHIEDLRVGEYYLYAVGYDSLAKKNVEGGIATTIKWSERKEMKSVDLVMGNQ